MRKRSAAPLMIAVVVFGGLLASNASAAVQTSAGEWYSGSSEGSVSTVSGLWSIQGELAEHPTIKARFKISTEIGGLKVVLTPEGFRCGSCALQNKEITSKAGAVASGTARFEFSNVSVFEPVNCLLSSETGVQAEFKTKNLYMHADWQDTLTTNKRDFIAFVPEAGASTTFAQFKLSGSGCSAIAGTYNLAGSLFGETQNNRGVMSKSQPLVFSPTVQTTTGAAMKLGTKEAQITGTLNLTSFGSYFGIK